MEFRPSYIDVPCQDHVYGCCYSSVLNTMVVSCGESFEDHRLALYSHFSICLKYIAIFKYSASPLSVHLH